MELKSATEGLQHEGGARSSRKPTFFLGFFRRPFSIQKKNTRKDSQNGDSSEHYATDRQRLRLRKPSGFGGILPSFLRPRLPTVPTATSLDYCGAYAEPAVHDKHEQRTPLGSVLSFFQPRL